MKTINILFPIKDTDSGDVFQGTTNTSAAVRSNLIALLTLKRGQRPMQSRMFSPIFDHIFEPLDEITQNELETEIKQKVNEFIPEVDIKKISYTNDLENNLLNIKITYSIKDFLNTIEQIELNIPLNTN